MAALNCIEIIERDENGDILKVGVEWNENTALGGPFGAFLRGLMIMAAAFFLIFAYFSFGVAGEPVDGFEDADSFLGNLFGILFGLPGLACLWAAFFGLNQPKRSVLFHRDGWVESPFGLPREKSARVWGENWNHPNITAIEAIGQDRAWRVDFIYGKGDTATVASALGREEARKVAVMLKTALDTCTVSSTVHAT